MPEVALLGNAKGKAPSGGSETRSGLWRFKLSRHVGLRPAGSLTPVPLMLMLTVTFPLLQYSPWRSVPTCRPVASMHIIADIGDFKANQPTVVLGNMKRFSLVGRKFGRLLVVRDAGTYPGSRKSCWETVCDCGTHKIALGTKLVNGVTKSCGCLMKEALRKHRVLPPGVAARNQVWRKYQNDAKRRGLPWELTFDDFCRLTVEECHYCGEPPSNEFGWRKDGSYNGTFVYNGVDRKDNSKGYTLNNVVPACDICNKAKKTLGYEQFIAWLIRAGQKQIQRRHAESNSATA